MTSRYKGSPTDPSSLVLSKTAILLTDFGRASAKCLVDQGLNNLTFKTPYLVF